MLLVCVNHAEAVDWQSLPKGAVSRLTESGRSHARAAGNELARLLHDSLRDGAARVRVKRVCSSPAAKCLQTAVELCRGLDGHSIVDLPANREIVVYDELLASRGQVSAATMDGLLQRIRSSERFEPETDRESAYLVCGHADLAAIIPNRGALGRVERKAGLGDEEWSFELKPTLVLVRCSLRGAWASAQTLGAVACESGTWVSIMPAVH